MGARRRYRRGRRQASGGERRTTTRGRAEELRKGVSGGMTGVADRRRDGRCRDRRGSTVVTERAREGISGGRRAKKQIYGQSYCSWGSGSVTAVGRAEALPEGATAGIRRRAPDHYSQAEA